MCVLLSGGGWKTDTELSPCDKNTPWGCCSTLFPRKNRGCFSVCNSNRAFLSFSHFSAFPGSCSCPATQTSCFSGPFGQFRHLPSSEDFPGNSRACPRPASCIETEVSAALLGLQSSQGSCCSAPQAPGQPGRRSPSRGHQLSPPPRVHTHTYTLQRGQPLQLPSRLPHTAVPPVPQSLRVCGKLSHTEE